MAHRTAMKAKREAGNMFEATHFHRKEVEGLLNMYNKIRRSSERLDKSVFRDVLHNMFGMTDELFMDRVFRVFDKNNSGHVDAREWIAGMSVFLRGTLQEQIGFCFAVYDFNGDGRLGRDELFHLYKDAVLKDPKAEDPYEGVRDLVDVALKKMDSNQDGFVSLEDFQNAVKSEPALLQAFGPCLPPEQHLESFLKLVS